MIRALYKCTTLLFFFTLTKLVCAYCGEHILESYCKESSISEKLAEISLFIMFDQNSVGFMTSSLG